MIRDISVRLADQAPPYPGDPPFERRFTRTIAGGDTCNFSTLSMSLHRGTHVDAPLHFIHRGKAVGDYPPERFILPAVVVEVPPGPEVRPEHFASAGVRPGEAVLLKTGNSRLGWVRSGSFHDEFVSIEPATKSGWVMTLRRNGRVVLTGSMMNSLRQRCLERMASSRVGW